VTRDPIRPRVLSIAGSDPSGGAGIQADLKTFGALGAYGMAALTALTAQNTKGVTGVHPVPPDFVRAQLDAVFDDIEVDAVKIGMLASAPIIRVVADVLRARRPAYVILDPVMVATSGDRLLDVEAVDALRTELLPLADLITPNLREAAVLLDVPAATNLETLVAQAESLVAGGVRRALVKGGDLGGARSPDVLAEPGVPYRVLDAPRIATSATHGTGCTLSSAITALRPRREDWYSAVADAKAYLSTALRGGAALRVGHGHGPLDHFA
jgi:hydroxymethylpyrimidine/phosphomethylpyrimidine kinase